MSFVGFFVAIIALFISVFVSILISQPFSGALVRLRANYLPKAVSLGNVLEDGNFGDLPEEGESSGAFGAPAPGTPRGVTPRKISAYLLSSKRRAAKIGPVVSGVFPMLMRTKRLEGIAGLYKGSLPTALQLLLLVFVTGMFFNVDGYARAGAGGSYKAAPTGPGQFGFIGNLFFMLFVTLITLPLDVITVRTIVHPRMLPVGLAHLRESLHEILSPAEIARPWQLYLIPGLLPATFAHVGIVGIVTRGLRHLLVPNLGGLAAAEPAAPGDDTYSGPNSSMKEVSPLALIIFLCWCGFSTVLLSPIGIVKVRLASQRPERQQPLHLAYSRLATDAGPASYSHQASVLPSDSQGRFSDRPARPTNGDGKPLPSKPVNQANGAAEDEDDDDDDVDRSRPSFAIDDDDDEEAGDSAAQNTTRQEAQPSSSSSPNGTRPPSISIPPRRDEAAPWPRPSHHHSTYSELPEPVIALRPVEEEEVETGTGTATGAAGNAGSGIEPGAGRVERYEGLKDCLDKLVEEEGVEALYRGAWVTALGALMGGLN